MYEMGEWVGLKKLKRKPFHGCPRDVKHFRNNADPYFGIKHTRQASKKEKGKAALFGEELMRLLGGKKRITWNRYRFSLVFLGHLSDSNMFIFICTNEYYDWLENKIIRKSLIEIFEIKRG